MNLQELMQNMDYGVAPESDSSAQAWLDEHQRDFKLFIDGKWVSSEKTPLTSTNPANGETLAKVANATDEHIDQAVNVACKAFKTWGKTAGHVRARYLYAIARQIQKHQRLFSVLESMDNGKPIRESRDIDIPLVVRHFYHHAGWAQLMETEMPDYQPVGVVGQIIPWNFPMLMMAWKIAPALAMGNTVVIKPAPATSLTALLFAEIVQEAGLPNGVVNIITGDDETGASIVNHDGFDKIAFTGSTNVGRIIRRATAGTGKRLSLELGGKSPFIVFEDSDQEAAVEGLVDAIWFNQGQVCCAGSCLLVQESIFPEFIEKVKRRMAKLRVGDSLDKSIDMGAIVSPVQYETIDKWVKIGIEEGASIFQPEIDMPNAGCYYPPTLLTDVDSAATVVQEEIFGPVLVAMAFRTPKEAVALANNTRYGLGGSLWTENVNLALEVATKIKAGSIWINCTNQFDAASGFGGYRESGFGREGGKEGLFEYVRPTWQNRPQPKLALNDDVAWGQHTPARPTPSSAISSSNGKLPSIDRTAKLYIGGKQKRPDGNYNRPVCNPKNQLVASVGDGNRKDIRDAVEAAHKGASWANKTGHQRAQILYYIAENLSARNDEFVNRLVDMMGVSKAQAQTEVDASISRLFTYAAYADKYGGSIQETNLRGITLAMNEPIGVMGIVCPDEAPLLSFVSLFAPSIARGNTVIIIPSQQYPLVATDFYQILDTSDVPAGVVNIVTGDADHLTKTLAEHDDVDALWYFRSAEGSYHVEYLSATNMKRTWVSYGIARDWYDAHQGQGEDFLIESTQVKNIWTPAGE